jgi:hypothetical protein
VKSKRVPNSEGTQFQPGTTGNPNGRPRKLPSIEKLLVEVLGDDQDEHSAAKAILAALATKAKKGDTRAAELLLDRGWGKAKQSIQIDTDPVKSLSIEPASKGK